jgi:hypothetical protein
MPTTGTNVFTVTRDDIIKASLRLLGVIGVGETPITEDYTNCSQALNIMIKSWSKIDNPLWIVQNLNIPMVTGVSSYQIGPTATGTGAVVMSRPMTILSAFIRDSSNNDTTLNLISRQEYDIIGSKGTTGTPNQFYFDRQEPNATLYVYNVPTDSTHTIHARISRQFYDMTSSTDIFDFPEEFFQALKWGLAAELAAEYGIPLQSIPYYEQKAEKYIDEAFSSSVEEADVFFTVDPQITIRHA